MELYDVVVLGAGPAGLAAGVAAQAQGARTIILEREKRLGGILKQCVHDGFGQVEFGERLSGPEYAERYIKLVRDHEVPVLTSTFVTAVEKKEEIFKITLVNSEQGVFVIQSKTLVLATGCRERTAQQVFIHGTRPAGVMTAGTAQYYVNIMGYLPCRRCVILGSGDIGLIMARRLTLEGAKVLGVYEAKPTPSGLSRNMVQCLDDYSIPLYLAHTITKVYGTERVEGVEISEVDDKLAPIPGTQHFIECDGVILSVGLIPENEIAESLNIQLSPLTKGPVVDQNFMTTVEGVFSCGNALHVNDLADYVSESGKLAGAQASKFAQKSLMPSNELSTESGKELSTGLSKQYGRKPSTTPSTEPSTTPSTGTQAADRRITVNHPSDFAYVVPQYIDLKSDNKQVVFYFRSKEIREKVRVQIRCGDKVLFNKKYVKLKPPEMERIEVELPDFTNVASVDFLMLEGKT